MAEGPTPEQQADYLVRKLEQTIRDNRTETGASGKGMSFRTWQAIAREEIANALHAADRRRNNDDRALSRALLVGSAALVSIGFWGAVVAMDHAYGSIAALVALVAGAALFFVGAEWGLRRLGGGYTTRRRIERLAHIEDLDRRIKRMEDMLKKKHDRLKDRLEEVGPL